MTEKADGDSRLGPRLTAAVPMFYVRNMDAAVQYYETVLGFGIAWTFGTPPELASVCRDEVEFNLALVSAERFQKTRAYVYVDDVDAYYERIVASGARILVPLEDRAYGMRDGRVGDIDGNEISFGSETGVSSPEWEATGWALPSL